MVWQGWNVPRSQGGVWMVWERQVQWEALLSCPTPLVPLLFLCFPGNSLSCQYSTSCLLIFFFKVHSTLTLGD